MADPIITKQIQASEHLNAEFRKLVEAHSFKRSEIFTLMTNFVVQVLIADAKFISGIRGIPQKTVAAESLLKVLEGAKGALDIYLSKKGEGK